eukprot:2340028-Pyramimonas_sp.AAC.2
MWTAQAERVSTCICPPCTAPVAGTRTAVDVPNVVVAASSNRSAAQVGLWLFEPPKGNVRARESFRCALGYPGTESVSPSVVRSVAYPSKRPEDRALGN